MRYARLMRLISVTPGARRGVARIDQPNGRCHWPDAPLRAWWQTDDGLDVLGLVDWDAGVGGLVLRELRVSSCTDVHSGPDQVLTLPIGAMLAEVAGASIPASEVARTGGVDFMGHGRRARAAADQHRETLDVVEQAERDGRPTGKAVMDHYGVSRATAARLIKAARESRDQKGEG